MKPPTKDAAKKNYVPPHIWKYGTLTEMTAAQGSGAMGDSIKGGGNKT